MSQNRSVTTCLGCGAPIEPATTGRPRRYPYCPKPDCQRLATAARQRNSRATRPKPGPVTSLITGANADLIAAVASLYLRAGDTVADVTYSTGRFWRKVDTARYRFLPSDLHPSGPPAIAADFRALPYRTGSLDVLVFDPPYLAGLGKDAHLSDRYNGRSTTYQASHADILGLYADGMAEASRVLRPGGQCWVKTKDTLSSEVQRWAHIAVHDIARDLGWYPRDLFLLVPPAPPSVTGGRWARQLHARKVHSYLWVFETGGYRRRKGMTR